MPISNCRLKGAAIEHFSVLQLDICQFDHPPILTITRYRATAIVPILPMTGFSLLEIVLAVPIKYTFSLYGAALQLANSCSALDEQIRFFLNPFLLKRHAAQINNFMGKSVHLTWPR